MDRRHFLKKIGVWGVGLSLPLMASPAWSKLMSGSEEDSGFSGSRRQIRSCKIIGIGGAGCNIVRALRSGGALNSAELTPEYLCIDLGRHVLNDVDVANGAMPDSKPIKAMSLAPLGAGGSVNYARVIALRNRDALKTMLADTDLVFLVAGLGGGTGSGVAPIMARLAREAGALVVAAVATPFEFENLPRHRKADAALRHLNRETNLAVYFSNQEWTKTHGDLITLREFFTNIDRFFSVFISGLMDGSVQLG